MNKARFVLLAVFIIALGWVMLFPAAKPASSSPLLGITLTATFRVDTPTNTPVTPTATVPTPTVPTPTQPVDPTPTQPANPTPTQPANNPTQVIPSLPPPQQVTTPDLPALIPVTGSDKSVHSESFVNLGLVLVACGLIGTGVLIKRKK